MQSGVIPAHSYQFTGSYTLQAPIKDGTPASWGCIALNLLLSVCHSRRSLCNNSELDKLLKYFCSAELFVHQIRKMTLWVSFKELTQTSIDFHQTSHLIPTHFHSQLVTSRSLVKTPLSVTFQMNWVPLFLADSLDRL